MLQKGSVAIKKFYTACDPRSQEITALLSTFRFVGSSQRSATLGEILLVY